MSFLDKLKVKVEEKEATGEGAGKDGGKDKKSLSFLQLDVDIIQTSSEIIVVAPIPGSEVKELDISIENENDVVTIQGKREMPDLELELDAGEKGENKFLRQECQWGAFYRQIILVK
jgi:HSP20 family molecular chaperone IbpA